MVNAVKSLVNVIIFLSELSVAFVSTLPLPVTDMPPIVPVSFTDIVPSDDTEIPDPIFTAPSEFVLAIGNTISPEPVA